MRDHGVAVESGDGIAGRGPAGHEAHGSSPLRRALAGQAQPFSATITRSLCQKTKRRWIQTTEANRARPKRLR